MCQTPGKKLQSYSVQEVQYLPLQFIFAETQKFEELNACFILKVNL